VVWVVVGVKLFGMAGWVLAQILVRGLGGGGGRTVDERGDKLNHTVLLTAVVIQNFPGLPQAWLLVWLKIQKMCDSTNDINIWKNMDTAKGKENNFLLFVENNANIKCSEQSISMVQR
jgi:hypothetical protein